jgi:hypothetical protein
MSIEGYFGPAGPCVVPPKQANFTSVVPEEFRVREGLWCYQGVADYDPVLRSHCRLVPPVKRPDDVR